MAVVEHAKGGRLVAERGVGVGEPFGDGPEPELDGRPHIVGDGFTRALTKLDELRLFHPVLDRRPRDPRLPLGLRGTAHHG